MPRLKNYYTLGANAALHTLESNNDVTSRSNTMFYCSMVTWITINSLSVSPWTPWCVDTEWPQWNRERTQYVCDKRCLISPEAEPLKYTVVSHSVQFELPSKDHRHGLQLVSIRHQILNNPIKYQITKIKLAADSTADSTTDCYIMYLTYRLYSGTHLLASL